MNALARRPGHIRLDRNISGGGRIRSPSSPRLNCQRGDVVVPLVSDDAVTKQGSCERRQLLLSSASLLGMGAWGTALTAPVAAAAEAGEGVPTLFEDTSDKFTISVPKGWASGQGEISGAVAGPTGARRTIAFFPDDPSVHDVSVVVVVTNVSVEFTKISSFGNIDAFAGNLVSSQDRSNILRMPEWARKATDVVQIAKLIDSKDRGGTYEVEYTIQKLPGPKRHLFSTVTLGSNGRYNRLFTVTGQCLEEDLPRFDQVIKDTVRSVKAELMPSI